MPPPRRILLAFHLPEALRDVLQGISDYVKNAHCKWQVLCVDADEFQANFAGRRADGAITAIRSSSRGLIQRIRRSATPVVNLLHNLQPLVPSVLSDDLAIGRAGAAYFIERGFRQFAFVGINTRWSRNRQQGFTDALLAASLPPPLTMKNLRVSDFRFTSKVRAALPLRRWVRTLPRGRIAAMTGCDFISRTLLTACEAENISVPSELAILGVDNFHTVCELSSVPLSSIAQDFVRMGWESASLLDGLIEHARKIPPAPILIPPGRLHVRTSSDVLAFQDPMVVAALRIIHEHASTGISMKELLDQVPLSRKWLDHRFKKLVGRTPSQEIRRCRLHAVRELLTDSDAPLRQIAARCRFSCVQNLIRCFRFAYGTSPQAFRRQSAALPINEPLTR